MTGRVRRPRVSIGARCSRSLRRSGSPTRYNGAILYRSRTAFAGGCHGAYLTHVHDLAIPALRFTPRDRPARNRLEPSLAGTIVRRALPPHSIAERFVAVREPAGEPYMIYRLPASAVDSPALRHAASLRIAHLQRIDGIERDHDGLICIIAEYPGSHAGLLSLTQLVTHKPGGVLSLAEAKLAAAQMLQGIAGAHDAGLILGALRMDEVLIDPRGRVIIELPGVEAALAHHVADQSRDSRSDLRAVASLVHELLTGIPLSGSPAKELRRSWRQWFAQALDREGFGSAREASDALPR